MFWCVATAVQAGDWPQWRGPTQNGFAQDEDLVDEWPASGPVVLWTQKIGPGYSACAVASNRVYTQTQTLFDQSLICLDADSGKELWSFSYGWPFDGGGLYPGPRSTPTVADGFVYFAATNGLIGCVNAITGSSVWSVNLKANLRGRGADFGASASPVVWHGKVIVPVGSPEGSLVALDTKSGSIVWKCGELPASYATPLIVPFKDRWLVVAPLENPLLCADAETGQRIWELDLSNGYDEHSAAPLYREPDLMIAGPFNSGATCYRLDTDQCLAGCRLKRLWDSAKFSNDIASSVLVGEYIYGFDLKDPQSRLHRPSRGEFRCLNFNDGKVQWSSSEPGHANVIVVDDKLLLFNDRGELRLSRVSPNGYDELARTTVFTDEICWTAPALSNGRVYLRTQQRLICLYIGRASLTSQQPTQTISEIPPASRFDPTTLVGEERKFPAASPEWTELFLWYSWTAGEASIASVAACIFALFCRPFFHRREKLDSSHFLSTLSSNRIRDAGFWVAIVSSGAFGSVMINRYQQEFVWTWPLALWGLMQLANESSIKAVLNPCHRSQGWFARCTILLFLTGCGLYFFLCRLMGLATEWSFLTGFVGACPASMVAIWFCRHLQRRGPLLVFSGRLLSYSLYFWFSVLFMKWRLQGGT